MAQTVAAHGEEASAEARGGNVFAFAWRQSKRHQPWLCLLAVLIFPLTMVPLELQRRIIDRAIGDQNLDLLLWLGAIYLGVVLLQGGLKNGLRVYAGMVSERTTLDLRRAVHAQDAGGGEGRRFRSSPRRRSGSAASSARRSPSPSSRAGSWLPCWVTCWWSSRPSPSSASVFFVPQILLVPMIQQFINRRARRKVKLVRELGDQIVDRAADHRYAGTTQQVYAVRMSYYRWKFASKLLNNLHELPCSFECPDGRRISGDQRRVHARHGGRVHLRVRAHGGSLAPAAGLLPARGRDQMQYRLIAQRLGD